jgi:hypothetical protein
MTMHLEGPWLSTTGKQKGKRKWASSEAKKTAAARQAEWDRKLVEFDKMKPKFSTGPYNAPRKTMTDYMPKTPPGRETAHIPSQDTGWVPVPQSRTTSTLVQKSGHWHTSQEQRCPVFSAIKKPKILAVCAVND